MKKMRTWRACVIVALGALAGSACFAQSTTDCSSVADDKSRLKCYDDQAHLKKAAATAATAAPTASPSVAMPAQSAGPATAHAPAKQPAPASSPPASGSSELGLERVRQKDPDASKKPDQMVVRVKDVTTRARGEYRITMEDGQVWQETQHLDAEAPKVGESVTIKRAAFGSYFLSRDKGLAFRVTRIQ
ncbi:MAG: hypothetical protein WDO56_01530 [Gammaproteobacteria bacterium]